MEKCPNCGNEEFLSEPNQYDIMTFKNGQFIIEYSESFDTDRIFCRGCGEEVKEENGKIVIVT